MQFFTMDWWVSCQDWESKPDLEGPSRAYEEYFAGIEAQLPPAIRDFHRAISLHDGTLLNVTVNPAQQMLMLAVECSNGVTVALLYVGFASYEIDAQEPRSLPGPAKFGDIGYNEFAVVDGGFAHSWLFSSGIEMTIVAENFAWETFRDG